MVGVVRSLGSLWSTAAAIATSLLLAAREARADPPSEPPPAGPAYRVNLAYDLPAVAVAGVVSSSWLLRGSLAPPHCAPVCDRADVPAFDRWAAGRWEPGWRTASDVGIAAVLVGAGATLFVAESPRNAAVDAIVVGESVLFANTLAIVAMMGARRPRPLAYGDAAPVEERTSGNASLSFTSGHTAGAAAAAVATFGTLRRLDRSYASWIALGVGVLGASFVGAARIFAGDHFPSDVAAGAVVGVASGVFFPALHERTGARVASSGSGLTLSGSF